MEQKALLRFCEDDVIQRQGAQSQEMYKILSGKVALYLNYEQADEVVLGILPEQRCFGEISILCKKPSVYTAVALEEVLLLRITEENFEEFIKGNSNNAIDIMKNLANTLVTLSFNLNQLMGELNDRSQGDPQKLQEIAKRIAQYTVPQSDGGGLFTMKL